MVCPTGKLRNERKIDAEEQLRRLKARGTKGRLTIYRCTVCNYWHVGHGGFVTREQHREQAKDIYGG